tara:strand:- start:818 stop:1276 length:459 start_codon:yes stop_codon:yes gene_type:complete
VKPDQPGAIAALMGTVLLAGCDRLPRDPNGTLRRVEGGTLVVGTTSRASLDPVEIGLVEALGEDLSTRLRWIEAPAGDLMRAVEDGRVDVVIGGIAESDPWSSRVAFSRPYEQKTDARGRALRMVLGVRHGENAFLLRIDRFIGRSRAGGPG